MRINTKKSKRHRKNNSSEDHRAHFALNVLQKPYKSIHHAVSNQSSPLGAPHIFGSLDHAVSNQSSPTKQTRIDHRSHLDVMKHNGNSLDVKGFLVVFAGFAIFVFILVGVLIFRARRRAKRNETEAEDPKKEPKKDIRETKEKDSSHLGERGHILKLAFFWVACMLMSCNYSFANQFAAYRMSLQNTYHLSDSTAGSVYTSMNTGAFFFMVVPGWIFDRYGLAMTSGFSTAVSVCSISLLRLTVATWWVPFCFLIYGFALSCFQTAGLVGVLNTFPKAYAGTASAGLILSIPLGVTVQSLVFENLYQKQWEFYQQYIVIYSLISGTFGMIASMLLKRCDHSSSRPAAAAAPTADQPEGGEEDPAVSGCNVESEEEDEVNEMCEAATEMFAQFSSMMSRRRRRRHVTFAGLSLERPQLRYQLVSLPFAFQMLVHCIDLAFGFSLLGAVANAAMSVGMDEKQVPRFVAMLGLVNTFGCVLLGMTSDGMVRCSKIFNHYFFFLVAYLLYAGSLLLLVIRPTLLPVCACVCIFAWGGTMTLAPGTIRAEFGAELSGRVYGLLFHMLAFTYTLWDYKVPHGARASFSRWFAAAAIAISVNLLASLLMWIRSMHTDSPLSAK